MTRSAKSNEDIQDPSKQAFFLRLSNLYADHSSQTTPSGPSGPILARQVKITHSLFLASRPRTPVEEAVPVSRPAGLRYLLPPFLYVDDFLARTSSKFCLNESPALNHRRRVFFDDFPFQDGFMPTNL